MSAAAVSIIDEEACAVFAAAARVHVACHSSRCISRRPVLHWSLELPRRHLHAARCTTASLSLSPHCRIPQPRRASTPPTHQEAAPKSSIGSFDLDLPGKEKQIKERGKKRKWIGKWASRVISNIGDETLVICCSISTDNQKSSIVIAPLALYFEGGCCYNGDPMEVLLGQKM